MPYDANSLADLTLKIIKGNFSPLPSHYSKGLVMLINCLLCVDQNKRPSVNDILSK
jgi:NIMA (never in mitosis gene a)-related kinase